MIPRKKLIEVALPLPEINDASSYDKMPGIGPHPKGIHHWWARLPLPAARAILFASVVDDPSASPETWPTEESQNAERERLFDVIRRMMGKKLHEHPEIYAEAREEMMKHSASGLPTVYDPFAGGGSIPLEASRLGCSAVAGDLNPIPVLLNKCNLEILPRWVACPPINPRNRQDIGGGEGWIGAAGLSADVRYYAGVLHDRATAAIGRLYPKVRSTRGAKESNVVAWLWARTVASPNPAARGVHVPLLSAFWLSNKKGNEAWLDPVVDRSALTYRFEVRTSTPKDRSAAGAGTKGKGGFRCLLTGDPIPFSYIRGEGQKDRLGRVLVAVVADGSPGRVYLPASVEQTRIDADAQPNGFPDTSLPDQALGFRVQNYGIRKHWQMFSPRQLTAMVTMSDLIKGLAPEIQADATKAGLAANEAAEYAATVLSFLALALDRCADFNNTLCRWSPSNQKVMNLFGQAIVRMVWDFAEANFLGDSVGAWKTCSDYVAACIEVIPVRGAQAGRALQMDAAASSNYLHDVLVSTDPPYYDNMGYAALSDFFYVWLRRTVGDLYPEAFATLLVPKLPELTASPERFDGNKEKAKDHFETGFRHAFTSLRDKMDARYPLTVYYAFKQEDEEMGGDDDDGAVIDLTTGWETLLEALIGSGFQITGTWPVRASQAWRMRAMGSNALASYIVLACRQREGTSSPTDRRSFVADLKRELPAALRHLQQGNIAPVDFAQAAIGPGMAVYSRYSAVLESDGKAMSARAALSLINQTLTEVLSAQEDDFDADTRWAISWFDQFGFGEGDFGTANTLATAKNTSVKGMEQAGILSAKGGRVRLLSPTDLAPNWDPSTDRRRTVWEMTHYLLKLYYHDKAGDAMVASLLRKLGTEGDIARELAYRLFDLAEKRKRSHDAQAYNALVLGWPEIARLAREADGPLRQPKMFPQE